MLILRTVLTTEFPAYLISSGKWVAYIDNKLEVLEEDNELLVKALKGERMHPLFFPEITVFAKGQQGNPDTLSDAIYGEGHLTANEAFKEGEKKDLEWQKEFKEGIVRSFAKRVRCIWVETHSIIPNSITRNPENNLEIASFGYYDGIQEAKERGIVRGTLHTGGFIVCCGEIMFMVTPDEYPQIQREVLVWILKPS